MSQESPTGWHTGAGPHPPTLAASSDPSPTLTTDWRGVQSCPAVYGGGSGGGNAIRSADPNWRMLPPPPPWGEVFIASFTALHRRQINSLEVSVYSPFTPPPWHTTYQKLSPEWGAGGLWIRTQAWAPHTQSRSSGRYCVKGKMAPLSGECLLHPKRQDSLLPLVSSHHKFVMWFCRAERQQASFGKEGGRDQWTYCGCCSVSGPSLCCCHGDRQQAGCLTGGICELRCPTYLFSSYFLGFFFF